MNAVLDAERRVLLVEDDEGIATLEARALRRAGFTPLHVRGVRDALAALSESEFAAILLDYKLADGAAWEVVDAANARALRVPVILVTAMGNEEVAVEALHRGVADYVRKSQGFCDQLAPAIVRVVRLARAEEELHRERSRLAEAQHIAQIGSWEWDVRQDLVVWSDELYRIFGKDARGFGASYEAFLECVHPADRVDVDAVIRHAVSSGSGFLNVYRIVRDGAIRFIEGRGRVQKAVDGAVLRMAGTAQDVTEREGQQAKLRESQAFFEQSLDMISVASTSGYFTRVSPAFKVLGYSEEELLTTPFIDLVHPDDIPATLAEVEKLSQGIKTLRFENRYRCKDGSYRWISWVSSPDAGGVLYGTGRDITEQKRAAAELEHLNARLRTVNANLAASLKEREILLQEVHHRVKNNLQVISSLINLQIAKLEACSSRDALEECRTRVLAIALIHEKLYQSSDYARIPFGEYVRSLTASILSASGVDPSQLHLDLDLEGLRLTVDQAIPCGLVLNELLTNALKHGLKGSLAGVIRVEFLKAAEGHAILAVTNDGEPLPPGFDPKACTTLGMHLVSALASQLDGELEVQRQQGTRFVLRFPLSEAAC